MPTQLAEISSRQFREALESSLGSPLSERVAARLFSHYQELRRWAARTALVGASEAEKMIERHYAESLLARKLVGDATRILDLGSGAGFPGWVLAAALDAVTVWLVESRQRKVAFLRSAAARAELSCRIVGARVSRRQPLTSLLDAEGRGVRPIHLVTIRAVKITDDIWSGLRPGLASHARILRWEGPEAVDPLAGTERGRTLPLPGRRGAIQEWCLAGEPEPITA